MAEWLCSGLQSRGRRFDSDPSLQSTFLSPGGGIGRRYGLKIRCPKGRAGSSPAPGTTNEVIGLVANYAMQGQSAREGGTLILSLAHI